MSNLGRLRRRSTRSAYRAARQINNNGGRSGYIKQPKEQLTFLEHSLKNGNVMLIGDTVDMLPNHINKPNKPNVIHNDIFKNIYADKIGLFYSIKQKKYMWIVLNADYSMFILYEDIKLYSLPNITYIDNLMNNNKLGNIQILEKANRQIYQVYEKSEILDLTVNPIIKYKVGEIYKK